MRAPPSAPFPRLASQASARPQKKKKKLRERKDLDYRGKVSNLIHKVTAKFRGLGANVAYYRHYVGLFE